MSTEEEPLSSTQEQWLDRLVDADLGQDRELIAYREFLDTAKSKLNDAPQSEWSGVSEGALVGRILSGTTREDLSWRGELRLMGGYVRERLRSSALLRIVAASLMLHLAAIPVVAFWVVRKAPAPAAIIEFEPGLQASSEPDFPLEAPIPMSGEPSQAPGAAAFDNAVRRARFVLSRAKGPVLSGAHVQDSLERKLLIGRSAFLQDRSWQSWWNESNQWSSASGLARVLWIELLLDAHVLEDRKSSLLGLYLAELSAAPRGMDVSLDGLRLQVIQRAQAYGLWPAQAGFDPGAVPEPLNEPWFRGLQTAAAGSDLVDLLHESAFAGWIAR